MAVCMLKQVLSIQDIKTLLTGWEITPKPMSCSAGPTPRRSRKLAGPWRKTCCTKSDLKQAALLLAVEANAKRAAAERILCELGREPGKKPKGE